MAFKEQIVPAQAKKLVYVIAPIISVIVAISAFAVVPLGQQLGLLASRACGTRLSEMSTSVFSGYSLSHRSPSMVLCLVAGPLATAIRCSAHCVVQAQMVSYETSLGLALSGTLMWAVH